MGKHDRQDRASKEQNERSRQRAEREQPGRERPEDAPPQGGVRERSDEFEV